MNNWYKVALDVKLLQNSLLDVDRTQVTFFELF